MVKGRKMDHDIFKIIKDDLLAVTFNMNDTFYYASADSSTISIDDLDDLAPLVKRYGRTAVVAYEALRRGHNPQIPDYVTPEFLQARCWIETRIQETGEYGEFFELRDAIKDQAALKPEERRKLSKWISKSVDRFYSFFTHR